MSQKPIYVFAKWQVKEGELDKVLSLFAEVARKSVAEEGNLLYTVHQSNADANSLLLYEAYKDESALADHRNSEHFQDLVIGRIVPMLENREIILTTRLDLERG